MSLPDTNGSEPRNLISVLVADKGGGRYKLRPAVLELEPLDRVRTLDASAAEAKPKGLEAALAR